MTKKFDAIIIGAGQAGPSLAGRLTAAGQTVAMIERKFFGGTCVNTGCKPTKTMVASAYAAHLARRAADYGFSTGGDIKTDMKAVKARKDKVTLDSRAGVEGWLDGMERCTVFRGHAAFVSPHEVTVNGETLSAERIFINVGGRANVPDMPGIDEVSYLTNSTMMDVDFLPEHLVIVGGSYIGLEFAQMYRRFGSKVTVVEKGSRLISREDPDISDAIKAILEEEGIAFRLKAECISFAPHEKGVSVGVDCDSGDRAVVGSHVLLAIGRMPNTDDLGLDKAGVKTDERGYITVDDELRTSQPHIYALGDCNGRGAFTHTAYNDFEIVAANLLDGDSRRVSDRKTRLCALHRPAARPRRHDRDRGEEIGPKDPRRHAADDPGRPRGRTRRDERLHEDRRRRRHQGIAGRRTARRQRRRGRARHSRHDLRQGALHGDAAHGADPPDRVGTAADRHRRHEAGSSDAVRQRQP